MKTAFLAIGLAAIVFAGIHASAACIDIDRAKALGSSHLHAKYNFGSDDATAGEYQLLLSLVQAFQFSPKHQVYSNRSNDSLYSDFKAYVEVSCAGVASSTVVGGEEFASSPDDSSPDQYND